jgi:hypothetical protein
MSGHSSHNRIRRLLHLHSDGLTSLEISERTEIKRKTVKSALAAMPDVYIDRWKPVHHESPHAVWIAIVPPENCPRPLSKEPKYERQPTKLRSLATSHVSQVR